MNVYNIREQHKHRARFKDWLCVCAVLLNFLEKHVRAALDPVFCENQNPKGNIDLIVIYVGGFTLHVTFS